VVAGSKYFLNKDEQNNNNLMRAMNSFKPSQLSRGEKIGDGSFGIVYRGNLNLPERSIPVAIKQMKERNEREVADLVKELDALRRLKHINVIEGFGIVTEFNAVDANGVDVSLSLVIELCDLGSLRMALDELKLIQEGKSDRTSIIAQWAVRLKVET